MELKLYEISEALRQLLAEGWVVDIETGEILFEGAEGLESLEMARSEKILSCAKYLKERKARLKSFEEERKRIEARLKAQQAQAAKEIAWLEDYILQNTEAGEKFKDATCTLGFRITKSVEVSEEVVANPSAFLSNEFFRVKESPDKTAIKNAIEQGQTLAGCAIIEKRGVAIR